MIPILISAALTEPANKQTVMQTHKVASNVFFIFFPFSVIKIFIATLQTLEAGLSVSHK
jgi:hypothetical protein